MSDRRGAHVKLFRNALMEKYLQPAVQAKGYRVLGMWEFGVRQVTAASLNFAAALLAAVALKPLRRRFALRNEEAPGMTAGSALA
ncbi:MAG: hypothetical protein ACLPWS_11290 [Rhodomicrobium sp.]